MSNYIPRSGAPKKRNILRQKELELRGVIKRKVSEQQLEKSAEKVRMAQLGVIKALIHEAEPARSEDEDKVAELLQNLKEAQDDWEEVPVSEIIEIYTKRGDKDVIIEPKKW